MKKKLLAIILIIILIVISIKLFSNEDDWICVDREWVKHGNPSAPKPALPCGISFEECKPEDRNVDACIEIYQPVCGMPMNQTFSNSCFACINESVIYYTEGGCA